MTFPPLANPLSMGQQIQHHYLTRPRLGQAYGEPTPSTPPFFKTLEAAGIPHAEADSLSKKMAHNQSVPFYVGRLLTGKIYLVSTGNQVFYGKPGNLKEMPTTEVTQAKCIDHPKRVLTLENGIRITITGKGPQKKSQVCQQILGLWLPLPHTFKSRFSESTH